MAEIVVVLLVLGLLAAAVLPSILDRVAEGRAAALSQSLTGLRDAVYEYRTDVRRYPTNLRFLSDRPVSASDICDRSVPTAFLDAWQGPYTQQRLTASGFRLAESTVVDTLTTEPATFTPDDAGVLVVTVEDVDSTVAVQVEDAYDGNGNLGAGTVRWSPTGSRDGTLTFRVPIRGC